MACQIEADAAIKTIFLDHKQKLMEQLNHKLTHKKHGEQLQTSACHMTSEGGLQHAGFQSQKKQFKKVWPQLKKVAKARTAAATKAAKAVAEKGRVTARPIHQIGPARKSRAVRKITAKQGMGHQVRRIWTIDSDIESSSDGSFVPRTPPMTRRKMHTRQAAQASTHTSAAPIPRASTLEYDATLMPMAPQLPIGQPPFTTDIVATRTSSQEVSLHSVRPNLEIGTHQTHQTHPDQPTSLVHDVPGIQRMLRPRPAA